MQSSTRTPKPSEPTALEKQRDWFRSSSLLENRDARPGSVLARKEQQKGEFRLLKQRFLDSEAKRQFLFAITGESPSLAPGENERLERENKEKKAVLKEKKAEVERLRVEIGEMAKDNEQKHAELSEKVAQVSKLQKEIDSMELELARLNAAHPPDSRMTMAEASETLDKQTERLEELTSALGTADGRIAELSEALIARRARVAQLSKDRQREEARAAEVTKLRSMGDNHALQLADWFGRMNAQYRALLGIRGMSVENGRTTVEYEEGVTLTMDFAPKLVAADVTGTNADMTEAINAAISANDPAGLVADILVRIRPL
ncbi:hypothetical protein A1Q2_05286 [Trichosporon asahii var. asahii CBS 8904]|uniref:Kinetochore protein Sos7 coiled-coil domain-containing protein n=1 Tax=Trichosporon asahii var. asahii (strain CBS 8904) TaxID=1220162 RepID=K1WFV4_TRIAC|nr:hypothetical protein A1Q2_05286 [Trichosporon asahii var. asahii CBS 8904]